MAGLFGQLGHRFVSSPAVSFEQLDHFHSIWIRVEFGHVGPGRKGCGCVPMGAMGVSLVVGCCGLSNRTAILFLLSVDFPYVGTSLLALDILRP